MSEEPDATNDRECAACEEGTFSSEADAESCQPRTECVAGEYVDEPGTASSDRVCEVCATGTFSTTANAASSASPTGPL